MPSGYQYFTALTTKWYQINASGTPPVAPPTTPFAGDTTVITASASAGAVVFTATLANTAGVKTELMLQPLKGKNRKPSVKGYTSRMFVGYSASPANVSIPVTPGYYAAAYRFVNTATGQETVPVPVGIAMVALAVEDGGAVEAAPAGRAKRVA